MAFNWNHFIEVAQDIEKNDYMSSKEGGKYIEAYQRIMVAQLYYAVFNLALVTGKKISNLMVSDTDKFHYDPNTVHGAIRSYLGKLSRIYRNNKELRLLLNLLPEDLQDLHELRKLCHYESEVEDLYSICESAIDISLDIEAD